MKKYKLAGYILLALSPFLTCCEKDRAGYDTPKGALYLSVDWQRWWFWQPKPSTIKTVLFPVSGDHIQTVVTDSAGGLIPNIPVNKYNYILLSGVNTEVIKYRGMGNYETAEIYLPDLTDKSGNRLIGQPSLVYADRGTVNIRPDLVTEQLIKPASLVKSLSIRIKIIGNTVIDKCTGRLSGVASAIRLNSGTPLQTDAAVDFEVPRLITDYFTRIQIFGFDKKSELTITCTRNGRQHTATVDISDQIALFNTDAASITLEIDLPETLPELQPSVSIVDWQIGNYGNIELN